MKIKTNVRTAQKTLGEKMTVKNLSQRVAARYLKADYFDGDSMERFVDRLKAFFKPFKPTHADYGYVGNGEGYQWKMLRPKKITEPKKVGEAYKMALGRIDKNMKWKQAGFRSDSRETRIVFESKFNSNGHRRNKTLSGDMIIPTTWYCEVVIDTMVHPDGSYMNKWISLYLWEE